MLVFTNTDSYDKDFHISLDGGDNNFSRQTATTPLNPLGIAMASMFCLQNQTDETDAGGRVLKISDPHMMSLWNTLAMGFI